MKCNYRFVVKKMFKILAPAKVACDPVYEFENNEYINTSDKFPMIIAIDDCGDYYQVRDEYFHYFDFENTSSRKTPEKYFRDYFKFVECVDCPRFQSILEGQCVVRFDVK